MKISKSSSFPQFFLFLSLFLTFFLTLSHAAPAPAPVPAPVPVPADSTRVLVKRGCMLSKPAYEVCDDPSVADIRKVIAKHGVVSRKTSLFYSGLGGAGGICQSQNWADTHEIGPNNHVAFPQTVPDDYLQDIGAAIMKKGGSWNANIDTFQKRVSQAFAEEAQGNVYIFTPHDSEPLADSTWAGWEFPALTRNDKVLEIIRVDPRDPADDHKRTIWRQGDQPTPEEPRG